MILAHRATDVQPGHAASIAPGTARRPAALSSSSRTIRARPLPLPAGSQCHDAARALGEAARDIRAGDQQHEGRRCRQARAPAQVPVQHACGSVITRTPRSGSPPDTVVAGVVRRRTSQRGIGET